MSNQKSKIINVNVLVSWGGAVIILALCAKILHFSWAENFIVFAFGLEALLFIVMGFQKMSSKDEDILPSISGIDNDMFNKLNLALNNLNKTGEDQARLIKTLLGESGVHHLSESLKNANKLSALDLSSLENEILASKSEFSTLNSNLSALNKVYAAQIEAFKIR